jgi:segregation and condensation protein A
MDQKVDVCDVPLARITDAFLARGLKDMDSWTLEEGTWFLAVCAVMLELKVGRLLPRPGIDTEEELLGGASPDLVYARSLELAAFRRLSSVLADRMAKADLMVPRTAGPPSELAHLYPDLMARITPQALQEAVASLLAPSRFVDLTHLTPIRFTLADAVAAVRARLLRTPQSSFRDLLADCEERLEMVVRFLALLELYREGQVELQQAEVFGEIQVRWQGGSGADRARRGEPADDVEDS